VFDCETDQHSKSSKVQNNSRLRLCLCGDREARIDVGTSIRTRPPEETLAQVGMHLPRMGVVRLADITGFDRVGLPVVAAVRPNARGPTARYGKGLTLSAARVSAAMEAVETYHTEHPTIPVVLGSIAEIAAGRKVLSTTMHLRVRGKSFDSNTEILWVEGLEVVSREKLWLPFESATFVSRQPTPYWAGFFRSESTGTAAGNTMLEATLHGLYEVIERDARTLFAVRPRASQAAARVDPHTVRDPVTVELIKKIESADLCPAIWDVTSDICIPCFMVRVLERDQGRMPHSLWSSGGGAHLSPMIALRRALTEALQGRAVLMSGCGDDFNESHYAPCSKAHGQNWKHWLNEKPVGEMLATDDLQCSSYEDELQAILDRLTRADFSEVVVVDLTQHEFGIPVVSVCVPEAEDATDFANHVPGPRLKQQLTRYHG
jgi:YcaO-like protein with predicted kinase domain